MQPRISPLAYAIVRISAMVGFALLLILVILPAVLSAQAASAV
jgi:hypothetical protein